uniref:Putative Ac81-like protein n=1 Tax=Drosophila-associated filamentous virus TaxID=2743186 RepID=A0A6M9U0B5_9VIRU|nr:putative Ac81-like protein [Drosophila-associated filamentous virus]
MGNNSSNAYEKKYTKELIDESLKPWDKWKNCEPLDNSIPTCLTKNHYIEDDDQDDDDDDETEICEIKSKERKSNLIYIKYRPTNIFCSLLNHWFIDINNEYRWDPGNPRHDILIKLNDCVFNNESLYVMSAIYELCNTCTYKYLLKNFCKDSSFNIIFFNCELILENFLQTILIILSLLLFIFAFLTSTILLAYLGFGCLIMYFSSANLHSFDCRLFKCRHIYSKIKNTTILT